MQKTKIDQVVREFGSQSALAKALNVNRAQVSTWLKDGRMPPLRAIQVESMTKGAFRAVDLMGMNYE